MAERLLYATPTGRHPTPGYTNSVRAIELTCKSFERGIADYALACGPVQMARSHLADRVLAEGYDYVLMHDDDLAVNPSGSLGNPIDVWKRLFDDHPDVGAIGAVYLREIPFVPTVVMNHPEYGDELCHVVTGFDGGPAEVAAVGTGFMMIRASALKSVQDDEPMFRFSMRRTRWGLVSQVGEDYDFCTRLRKAGWRVLADPRFDTIHYKEEGRLTFNLKKWSERWSDQNPNIRQTAEQLVAQVGGNGELAIINGYVCIDHTKAMIAEAKRREATRKVQLEMAEVQKTLAAGIAEVAARNQDLAVTYEPPKPKALVADAA